MGNEVLGRRVSSRRLGVHICIALIASMALAIPRAAAEPVPGDPCENGDIRLAQSTSDLPRCLALEMVSPARKFNQRAALPTVAASGDRIRFSSGAALGETPNLQNSVGDVYVAGLTSGGWVTQPTSPPIEISNVISSAESFSPEMTEWVHRGIAMGPDFRAGIGQLFEGHLGGPPIPRSPVLIPLTGPVEERFFIVERSRLQGVSGDRSALYLEPGDHEVSYLEEDPVPAGAGGDANVYVAEGEGSQVKLALLARDSSGTEWGERCGARVGGVGGPGGTNQGAVSQDGDRVYFSTRPTQPADAPCDQSYGLRIMTRIDGPLGPSIFETIASECDRPATPNPPGPCAASAGDDFFQAASLDGSKLYFTTTRQLASTDVDLTSDLYLLDGTMPFGSQLTQVSAGGDGDATPGAGAKVATASAISADGSRAYFVSPDVLTTAPGPAGAVAQSGQANLYVYERDLVGGTGEIAFIADLGAGDGSISSPYAVPKIGPGGGDGRWLLFLSEAPLLGDADGTALDLYRYDAEDGSLTKISAASGGSDSGSFDVAVSTGASLGSDSAEVGRWASEDAGTIVFETQEGLVAEDQNGKTDSYLWADGDLFLVPGSTWNGPIRNGGGVVSHDGSTIAFQTDTQLLPQDGDSVQDIYALREDGGFRIPQVVPCTPNADVGCQGPAAPAPAAPPSWVGPGNVQPPKGKIKKRCPKGTKRVVKKGKVRCVKKPRKKAQRNGGNQK